LAPTTLDVEREPPRSVPPDLRLGRLGEQLPNVVEHARVGGRVRPWGQADRRLVDADDLVDEVEPRHPGVAARDEPGAVDDVREHRVEDVLDERRLARATD